MGLWVMAIWTLPGPMGKSTGPCFQKCVLREVSQLGVLGWKGLEALTFQSQEGKSQSRSRGWDIPDWEWGGDFSGGKKSLGNLAVGGGILEVAQPERGTVRYLGTTLHSWDWVWSRGFDVISRGGGLYNMHQAYRVNLLGTTSPKFLYSLSSMILYNPKGWKRKTQT